MRHGVGTGALCHEFVNGGEADLKVLMDVAKLVQLLHREMVRDMIGIEDGEHLYPTLLVAFANLRIAIPKLPILGNERLSNGRAKNDHRQDLLKRFCQLLGPGYVIWQPGVEVVDLRKTETLLELIKYLLLFLGKILKHSLPLYAREDQVWRPDQEVAFVERAEKALVLAGATLALDVPA